ncbi:hypothetical protein [Mesorhizobium sp.]|uniref:hypothetical protein n=1 Tax=Mesorhizobium sp. TaxID=1871066 RepID=UPI0012154503|nr:hypothetical protein [Mesorhizobium sp.]TIX28888.1 MAG: hypothetical protein E5V35_00570 [Mesorhizobium sp.]
MTIMHSIMIANLSVAAINVIGMASGADRLIPPDTLIGRNFGRSIVVLDVLVWVSVFALVYR